MSVVKHWPLLAAALLVLMAYTIATAPSVHHRYTGTHYVR
jgi:hypothetical protein